MNNVYYINYNNPIILSGAGENYENTMCAFKRLCKQKLIRYCNYIIIK